MTLSLFPILLGGRSCTGTLAVIVEDENDNSPEVLQSYLTVCKPKMGYADISAADPDEPIHGPPFSFSLASTSPEITRVWVLTRLNGIQPKITIYVLSKNRVGLPVT